MTAPHTRRPPTRLQARPILVLAALLALVTPSAAQEATVSLTVRGLTGQKVLAKPRRFVSVTCVLENRTAADVRGTLRAYRTTGSRTEAPAQSLFYEQEVEVPRAGRRVVTLYYYCQENEPRDRLCVSFEPDEGAAPPPAFPAFVLTGGPLQVLVLSSRPAIGAQAELTFRSSVVPAPARPFPVGGVEQADLTALPDHLAGYEPFDAVVVTDLDPGDLPDDRAAALLGWVEAGGDLIVVSSGRGRLPPSLDPSLPVVASGVTRTPRDLVALAALAPIHAPPTSEGVLVETVRPRPGSALLAGTPEAPLVVRGRHGAGSVTYLAFPLDAAPLTRWKGLASFGAALLRPPREDPESGNAIPPAPPQEELFLNLSEALETLEPPSGWLVAPLLLLYVALVSPLNFILLSRARRLHLAQLVAGGVAVGFGFLFYGIGFFYKGSEAMVTQIGIVELADRAGGRSRVEVMTGFFSTDRGLTEGTAPLDAVVGPIADRLTSREGRVRQTPEGIRLEALTLDTWALRRFRSLRAADLGHVSADLRFDGSVLKGTVENRTDLELTHAVLLFEHGYMPLKGVAAGQRLELAGSALVLHGGANPRIPAVVAQLLRDAKGRYPSRYGEGLGLMSGGTADPERRILETLERRVVRSRAAPGRVPALLVGLAGGSVGGVTLAEGGIEVLTRTIVLAEVDAEVATGQLGPTTLRNLPPRVAQYAIFRGEPLWQPTSGQTSSPGLLNGLRGGDLNPLDPRSSGAWVEFQWRLPSRPAAPLSLSELRLDWRLPRPGDKGILELWAYDFRSARWRQLQDVNEVRRQGGMGSWPEASAAYDAMAPDLVDPASGLVRVLVLNRGKQVLDEPTPIELLELTAALSASR